MWWIPVTLIGGYLIKKIFEDSPKEYTALEKNFYLLKILLDKLRNECVIAVLGQPGAGKSSLINKLSKGKASPKPEVGISTDMTDWSKELKKNFFSFYNDIIFLDTPGYDTIKHPVKDFIDFPFSSLKNVIFVLNGKIKESDEKIFKILSANLLNKPSKIVIAYRTDDEMIDKSAIIEDLKKHLLFKERYIKIVFFSNRYNIGIDELKSLFKIN